MYVNYDYYTLDMRITLNEILVDQPELSNP